MVPFPDVSKLSAIAAHLEQRYPNASIGEIYAMAKPTVENAIAVQVAGGNRNTREFIENTILMIASAVLFRTPQMGEPLSRRLSFSRPISRKPSFGQESPQMTGSPSRPSQRQQRRPSQQLPLPEPLNTTAAQPVTTPTYDLETWFNPVSAQTTQTQSSSQASAAGHPHPQVPPEQTAELPNTFYSNVRPRPRHVKFPFPIWLMTASSATACSYR
jgi:hypothetical protein